MFFAFSFAGRIVKNIAKGSRMELKMMKLIVAGMVMMVANALASPTVFVTNPYTSNVSPIAALAESHNGVLAIQSYTDVDYDGSYKITDFHWWGMEPMFAQNLNGFRLQIFANSVSDAPGSEVYSEFFDSSIVAMNDGPDVWDTKYGVNLTTPFAGAAGKYWFSVTADLSGYGMWGWTLTQGKRLGHDDWQYYKDPPGTWGLHTEDPGDLSFEVTGESLVPEPASLTLFGIGLASGLAAIRRRKKSL